MGPTARRWLRVGGGVLAAAAVVAGIAAWRGRAPDAVWIAPGAKTTRDGRVVYAVVGDHAVIDRTSTAEALDLETWLAKLAARAPRRELRCRATGRVADGFEEFAAEPDADASPGAILNLLSAHRDRMRPPVTSPADAPGCRIGGNRWDPPDAGRRVPLTPEARGWIHRLPLPR